MADVHRYGYLTTINQTGIEQAIQLAAWCMVFLNSVPSTWRSLVLLYKLFNIVRIGGPLKILTLEITPLLQLGLFHMTMYYNYYYRCKHLLNTYPQC